MVCSFLEIETTKQINKFLQNNQNYIVDKFKINKNNLAKNFITENNFILTLPKKIMNNIKVDGYFACKLFKTND